MKNFFRISILMAGFMMGSAAFAYDIHVEGVLMSYDQKRIKLRQENGKEVYIPRTSFGSLDGYASGKAQLKAAVKAKELVAANRDSKAKM